MLTQQEIRTRADRSYALVLGVGAFGMGTSYVIVDTLPHLSIAVLIVALVALVALLMILLGWRDRVFRRRDRSALRLVLLAIALRAVFAFIPSELHALRLISDVVIVLPLLVYSVRLWLGAGRRAGDGAPETAASGA